jgi:cell division protein ZapD
LRQSVIYEFPLNERVRLFIRLEQLFGQLDHFMAGNTIWDARVVVSTLVDVVGVFNRNDLKAETLQEIDRQSAFLNKMAKLGSGIDQEKLGQILKELEKVGKKLYSTPGKVGQTLQDNELFKSISQRSNLPGGTCSFDSPSYHHWLRSDESQRRKDLEVWIEPFVQVRTAIEILLNFIRTCAKASHEVAPSGFYQKALDFSLPYQLVRVEIEEDAPYYAEISGGKHRFTIRFMKRDSVERSTQTTEDIEFLLTCCLF